MFRRGYKSWCENLALQVRADLQLAKIAPLRPEILAKHLGVFLWSLPQVRGLSAETLRTLSGTERRNWSAVAVSYDGRDAIVYNPTHSLARQSSDVMHELSHILIGHEASKVFLSQGGTLALRTFNRQDEDEANWLSGCLLLPRPALVRIKESGLDHSEACEEYRVSNDLLTYRLNVTGVSQQIRKRGIS